MAILHISSRSRRGGFCSYVLLALGDGGETVFCGYKIEEQVVGVFGYDLLDLRFAGLLEGVYGTMWLHFLLYVFRKLSYDAILELAENSAAVVASWFED